MDRHQDKRYEEEQINSQGGANQAEPMDDMRYFLELTKAMRELIEDGRSVMGRWKLIDAKQALLILDDLYKNLPVAIQYGLQMYNERDRIMGNSENEARDRITTAEMRAKATTEAAKREADRIINDATDEANAIIADAQERADFMVSEDEILRRAREDARSIKNDAAIEITEERLKTNHEMLQLVLGVEDGLSAALDNIVRRRKELEEEIK